MCTRQRDTYTCVVVKQLGFAASRSVYRLVRGQLATALQRGFNKPGHREQKPHMVDGHHAVTRKESAVTPILTYHTQGKELNTTVSDLVVPWYYASAFGLLSSTGVIVCELHPCPEQGVVFDRTPLWQRWCPG